MLRTKAADSLCGLLNLGTMHEHRPGATWHRALLTAGTGPDSGSVSGQDKGIDDAICEGVLEIHVAGCSGENTWKGLVLIVAFCILSM